MIYFRDRKYGGQINTSFFVKNGGEIDDLSRFQVGDRARIFFRLTPAQAQAVRDRDERDLSVISDKADEWEVFVSFRVVERSHGLDARGGDLHLITSGLVLEAETGAGEDVLRWVCCGEQPAWVEEE